MIMIGPAIGYILMGAATYKYRSKLKMNPSQPAEYIGNGFWRGGWFALIYSILSEIAGTPEPYAWLGMVAATIWAGSRAIVISNKEMQ